MSQRSSRRVAVVLGAPVAPDGTESPALARRIDAAVALGTDGAVDRLLLTGGATTPGWPPEAEWMAGRLVQAGIARDRVIVEPRALTTRQNARHSLTLLRRMAEEAGRPDRPVDLLVVTDLWHLPRALMLFAVLSRRMGMTVTLRGHGVRPARPTWRWYAAQPLREAAALVADALRVWRA